VLSLTTVRCGDVPTMLTSAGRTFAMIVAGVGGEGPGGVEDPIVDLVVGRLVEDHDLPDGPLRIVAHVARDTAAAVDT
jgi:hypothetical protein